MPGSRAMLINLREMMTSSVNAARRGLPRALHTETVELGMTGECRLSLRQNLHPKETVRATMPGSRNRAMLISLRVRSSSSQNFNPHGTVLLLVLAWSG